MFASLLKLTQALALNRSIKSLPVESYQDFFLPQSYVFLVKIAKKHKSSMKLIEELVELQRQQLEKGC